MKKLSLMILTAVMAFGSAAATRDKAAPKEVRNYRNIKDGNYGLKAALTPAVGTAKWWMGRIKSKKAQAVKEGKDIQIVLVGDSITHFWEKKANQAAYKQYFGKYNVLNLGCSSDCTPQTLWIIEKSGIFEQISPKMIVVMIGTNNTGTGLSGEIATTAAVKRCVEALRQAAPEAKIILFAIFSCGVTEKNLRRQKNEIVNRSIKDLADGENIFFVDINRQFLDKNGIMPKKLMPDYLHPSTAGYHIWGKAITPYIKRFVDGKKK